MSNTNEFFKEKKRWSIYKDKILGLYLKPYFQKIMRNPYKTIYIDGFAGKGKFEDGSEGSPLIVNKIIKEVEESSRTKEKMIFPIFIEKKYASELENALQDKTCKVFGCDYKSKSNEILDKAKSFNVFMYVDPFGIKDLDFSIFEKLSQNKNSVELLLNLNSFGFIREGCRLLNTTTDVELEESAGKYDEDKEINNINNMNRIANGEEWQEIILKKKTGVINAKTAEEMFTALYVEKLGELFKYVFSISIRTGDDLVPKYQMIFATNHIQGALIMADNMIKCDIDMSSANKNGQQSFFDYDFTKNDIKKDILSIVKKNNIIDAKQLCLELYRTGKLYLQSDIKNALKELSNSNLVLIDRRGKKTPTGKDYTGMDFIKFDILIKDVK